MSVLPLATQQELVRKYRRRAAFAAVSFIGKHHMAIEALALERLTEIGFAEYGDSSFRLTPAQLFRERMEEAADLVVYGSIRLAIESGELV